MTPLGKEHNQLAREALAEQGIEMTPDELARERKAAYDTIRTEMRAQGYNMPDSDEEMFFFLQQCNRIRNFPDSRCGKELAKLCVALTAAVELDEEALTWQAVALVAVCVRRNPVLSKFVDAAKQEMRRDIGRRMK